MIMMTKELSIEQGNKLIAEFMGAMPYYLDSNVLTFPAFENPAPSRNETTTHHAKDLLYHSSWDWLMPVVEKIKNDHFVAIEMYGDFSVVEIIKDRDYPAHERKIYSQHKETITATFGAVIQFIQWYNSQKQ